MDRLIKGIYHVEKRFGCILHATRCIESVAQILLNRNVDSLEFPSGYLSGMVTVIHMSLNGWKKSLLAKRQRDQALRRTAFALVHAQITVSHAHRNWPPCASVREEDTYMPTRDVSGNIRL